MPDGERWAEPEPRPTPDEAAEWAAGRLDEEMRLATELKRRCNLHDGERWARAQEIWDDVYPRWVEYFRTDARS